MEEFDQKIKDAKKELEPRKDFVEMTMQRVQATKPKKTWRMRFWLPLTGAATAVVIVAILLVPTFTHSNGVVNSTTGSASKSVNSTPSTSSTTPSVPAGTDNASLDSDMDGINSSMNQDSNDQSSADSAVNDSSQEITIPSS